ncbi:MAG TPA: hypothetical protein VKB46_01435 [Pyrinomonadaceae bacterium]|nr:hypothetical protein [Pyrinomonadaceae bacterium]
MNRREFSKNSLMMLVGLNDKTTEIDNLDIDQAVRVDKDLLRARKIGVDEG